MAATGQFSCPPAGSFVAVSGQFLVAAVTPSSRSGLVDRDNLRFAAGIALCEVSGCVISDLDGNPLYTGRGLTISADQETHDRVLALVELHLRAIRSSA